MLTQPTDRLIRAANAIRPLQRRVMTQSPQTNALLTLSDERGFGFKVLGRAPFLKEDTYTGDFWLRPIENETQPIPARAMERAMSVYQAGIRPKGWLIAHEVPKMLGAGKTTTQSPPTPWWKLWVLRLTQRPLLMIGLGVGIALLAPFILGLILQALIGVVMAVAVPLAVLGIAGAALADPVLIAVTEDNYWVEVDRWK